MSGQKPIIVKKIKKGHHGHHGGAWKLAYADFVTAMMAFFLLMWLLGTVNVSTLQGIAEYFKNPFRVSLSGGNSTGDATAAVKGGGEDLSRSAGQVKRTNDGSRQMVAHASENDAGRLNALKLKLEQLIEASPQLQPYRNQLRLDFSREGLRVQIIDQANRPMFDLASAQLQPYARQILREITPLINSLPNAITISGHTDAHPYAGGNRGYSNWELSADRANAARREMIADGLQPQKVLRVIGQADSVPLVADNPLDPTNRRISVNVMTREAEQRVRANAGSSVEVGAETLPSAEQLAPERAAAAAAEMPEKPAAPSATRSVAAKPAAEAAAGARAAEVQDPGPGASVSVPPLLPPGLVPAEPTR